MKEKKWKKNTLVNLLILLRDKKRIAFINPPTGQMLRNLKLSKKKWSLKMNNLYLMFPKNK